MKAFFSKRPRLTIALLAFFAVQIILILWFLPEFVRRTALDELAALVDAPVQIEDVDLNLFTRRARVVNFAIENPRGGRPLVQFPKIELKFAFFPLFRGDAVVRSISFTQPRVFVERLDGGRFNLIEIIRPQEGEPGGIDLTIERLEIQGGEIAFVDRTVALPSEHVLKDVRLRTGKLSTAPEFSLTPTAFNLDLAIGAGTIAVKGSTSFFGSATGIDLSTRWNNLDPGLFSPYFPSHLLAEFSSSFLNGEARYLLKHEGEKTVAHLLTVGGELGPFRLLEADRPEPALAVAGMKVQDARLDFLAQRYEIGEFTLSQPYLLVDRAEGGELNLARLFAPDEANDEPREETAAEEAAATAPEINILRTTVEDGNIEIKDRTVSPGVGAVLKQLRLEIRDLSFSADAAPGALDGEALLEGGTIRLTGTLRPEPFDVRLSVDAQKIAYEPFRGYVDSALAGGGLRARDLDAKLQFSLSTGRPDSRNIELSGKIEAQAPALEVAGVSRAPVQAEKLLLEIDRIRAGASVEVDIGRVRFDKAELRLERDSNGDLNLEPLWKIPEKSAVAVKTASTPPAQSPALSIRRVELDQANVRWLDRAAKPEVQTEIRNLRLTMTDLPLGPKAKPGLLEGEGQIGKAPLRVKGSVGFSPFTANLALTTKNLPLAPYRGYIDPGLAGWEARDGEVDGSVNVSLGPATGDRFPVQASGKLEAGDLVLGLRGRSEPPFRAKSLAVDLARLNTVPALDLELTRVKLSGAQLKIARDEKGNLNLKSADEGVKGESAKSEPDASKTRIVVGGVEIAESRVEFADRSIEPNFQTELSDISVAMGKAGIADSRTPITLRAKLDESAGIELKGWFTPFHRPLRVQLEGKIADYDLAQINPYAAKYIRYEIKRGRVTTDVDYRYDEGDLEGDNEISIRRLQLGEQLGKEFEEQVGISLKLALALLEDLDGRIRLQVPVSGNINSPGFSIAGVVWKAFRNALINFLAAPFKLLGNVLTVGGKITEIRIDPVRFAAGSFALDAQAEKRLKDLAQFLKGKPRLEIEIRGASAQAEAETLKKQKLRREIKPGPRETYAQALLRLYRSAGGAAPQGKSPTADAMESYLAKQYSVSDEDLIELAEARERAVGDALIGFGVERGRVFASSDTRVLKEDPSGRVEFKLLY